MRGATVTTATVTNQSEVIMIIDNIFEFKIGDIVEIFDAERWSILGHINDPKAAALDFHRNNFTIMGKPARVIRRA